MTEPGTIKLDYVNPFDEIPKEGLIKTKRQQGISLRKFYFQREQASLYSQRDAEIKMSDRKYTKNEDGWTRQPDSIVV